MTDKVVKGAGIDSLIRRYAEAAAAHGKATEEGDYKTANRQAKTIIAVCRELRGRGPEAQRALLGLLGDTNPHVLMWAAAHALEFAPEHGEPVLIRLSQGGRGVASLDAEITLQEWQRGALQFP